ncbi:NAD(P)H-dependent glycerol-3-phosphate dehydrogenase [Pseudobacter ginsenosidimutans]|uniref:Glycerol-3-phosphate dehydrogenase n=1 Tax=Pseudobacter ginsenosidimutans TaxID=661488 RepID=A0A4Q7MYM2_9BACT|nr:NAD(P)H-dependent glycerol-3-phosphate dehydrogenase [Pseudobacter ginsenosidimutans]QEC40937.1 glycerol-3-phosphate dehydrogenase [Pseudobacter ginsenosidimutans]RZS72323.1 glycerol-3-phosphate dehydrogenase (NAD(P)+) [Pseudobacter ginsenosidimutans]
MRLGIIGSGSWATALAKILTDNKNPIGWWVRSEHIVTHIKHRRHNPSYLSSAYFDADLVDLSTDVNKVVSENEYIVIAVPSAYIIDTLEPLPKNAFEGKKVISAVKGIIPQSNLLLNDYLAQEFNVDISNYYTIMGPCHAEEVAAEKLSYLTFSGTDAVITEKIAARFHTEYLNTVVNTDVVGVQYAAILKNIYALGAGIAHGLEYGDNFLSVLIANCADEMAVFLKKVGIQRIEVGVHEGQDPVTHRKTPNYAASVYLGDLLVTCYSLFSRNRTFGNMIGKGYSVRSAQLEMNMVAEGYNAAKSIHLINKTVGAEMPIAESIYRILWENVKPSVGYKQIEQELV